MNWFKFAQLLLSLSGGVVDMFVKNPTHKKTADSITHLAGVMVEGLSNQNPDGTPAKEPYSPVSTTT